MPEKKRKKKRNCGNCLETRQRDKKRNTRTKYKTCLIVPGKLKKRKK